MNFTLNASREMHVETIRGLACVALVSFHAIGSDSRTGLELPADDWLVQVQACFAYMRMPLFSFISGYVFTSFATAGRSWGTLWLSKMRRLLLPLVSVGLLYWSLRAVMGYSQPGWPQIVVLPYMHFWFLQATFVLMSVLLAGNWLWSVISGRAPDARGASVIAAALGLIGGVFYAWGTLRDLEFFSIPQAAYLAPFFMAGHVVALRGKTILAVLAARSRWLGWAGIAAAIVVGTLLAFDLIEVQSAGAKRVIGIVIGLVSALSLFVVQPKVRFLAWVGDKSYAIYLFHVLFLSVATEIWRKAVAMDIHWAYLPALLAGLLGPIAMQAVILRSNLLSVLFLGLRPRRKAGRELPSGIQSGAT